jgi:hypothetical protein
MSIRAVAEQSALVALDVPRNIWTHPNMHALVRRNAPSSNGRLQGMQSGICKTFCDVSKNESHAYLSHM